MEKAYCAKINVHNILELFFDFMHVKILEYIKQSRSSSEDIIKWSDEIKRLKNKHFFEIFKYLMNKDPNQFYQTEVDFNNTDFTDVVYANMLINCESDKIIDRIKRYINEVGAGERVSGYVEFYECLYVSIVKIWNSSDKQEINTWCKKTHIKRATVDNQEIQRLANRLLTTHYLSGTTPSKRIYLFTVGGQSTISSWHGANVMMFVSPTQGIYIIYMDDGHLAKLWADELSEDQKTDVNIELISKDDSVFDFFEDEYGIKMYNYKTLERTHGKKIYVALLPIPKWTVTHVTPVRGFLIDDFNECNMIGFKEPEQQGGVLSSALKILIIAILVIIVIVCVVIYIHNKYWFNQTKAKPKI
jgi:hypothetical protein